MDRLVFSKFEDREKIYRIRVNVGKLNISLIVLEEMPGEMNAYKSQMILEQNLRTQASSIKMNIQEYFDKLITLFEQPSKTMFTFNKRSLTLLEAANSNLHVKYFNCEVTFVEDLPSFIGGFIDEIQVQNMEIEKKFNNLNDRHTLLEKETIEYKNKLNELVERKKGDDDVMLGNFVLLLNEKKRRIQHLTELLEAYRTNPELANPVEVNVNSKRKRKIVANDEKPPCRIKEVSETDSDGSNNGYNTSDSEQKEDIKCIEKKVTIASQYMDDIFESSPPKTLENVPKITEQTFAINLPSTSRKNEDEDQKPAIFEEPEKKSNSLYTPVVDINTQDWLDEL